MKKKLTRSDIGFVRSSGRGTFMLALIAVALPGCNADSRTNALPGGATVQSVSRNEGSSQRARPSQSATSNEAVLYSFKGDEYGDGAKPSAPLVMDRAGNLFGTTAGGGSSSAGTVFELTPQPGGTYAEKTIYAFAGTTDGAEPLGALTLGQHGELYGTTSSEGDPVCHCGTLFALRPSVSGAYNFTHLYTFLGGSDGANPEAGLVADRKGNLYGTTAFGGNTACTSGCGTVFEFSPANESRQYSQIIAFTGPYDGAAPISTPIIATSLPECATYPILVFTTERGGASQAGTVYFACPLPSGLKFQGGIVHSFGSSTDGAYPISGVVQIPGTSTFAGTTERGGSKEIGTVFAVSYVSSGNWHETVLHDFGSIDRDGSGPAGSLVEEKSGELYGTTSAGGKFYQGTAFKVSSAGANAPYKIFFDFGGANGSAPLAGFIAGTGDVKGSLLGTTGGGGANGSGSALIFNNEF